MADKYVPIFFDWPEATQELNAQEKGRLIDAIVLYARGGDWSELLKGNERYVFPMFQLQIDRAKQISSIRAGVRKNKTEQNEQNTTNGTNRNKNYNNNKNKEEYKNKNEEENNHHEDDDARARISTVEAYATGNLQHLSPRNMEELVAFKDELAEDLIRFAIDEACANGAPRWAYVRAVLDGFKREGIKTVGDAKAAKEKHKANGGKAGASKPRNYDVADEDWFF